MENFWERGIVSWTAMRLGVRRFEGDLAGPRISPDELWKTKRVGTIKKK